MPITPLIRRLLGTLLITASLTSHAGGGAAQLQNFYKETQTLRAQFTQIILNDDGQVTQRAEGTFYLSQPGRFRWEYIEPFIQLIIADGRNIWLYDEDLEQVTVKPQSSELGDTPALLLTQSVALDERFNIRELGNIKGVEWVELSPKATDSNFKRVRLGFSEQTLQAMELRDAFDQTTYLEFSNSQRNIRLKDELFRFVVPAGVDVVGEQQ
ncbi:MAG: outer membrane lipoprotein chaperone LolA [Gammaproteobacteria bacterium]|nr:outer membrane lipoprotein chaperone LolA [Gammaproteobacteria bacterium]